jgi:hypothetical protein
MDDAISPRNKATPSLTTINKAEMVPVLRALICVITSCRSVYFGMPGTTSFDQTVGGKLCRTDSLPASRSIFLEPRSENFPTVQKIDRDSILLNHVFLCLVTDASTNSCLFAICPAAFAKLADIINTSHIRMASIILQHDLYRESVSFTPVSRSTPVIGPWFLLLRRTYYRPVVEIDLNDIVIVRYRHRSCARRRMRLTPFRKLILTTWLWAIFWSVRTVDSTRDRTRTAVVSWHSRLPQPLDNTDAVRSLLKHSRCREHNPPPG